MRILYSFLLFSLLLTSQSCISRGTQIKDMKRIVQASAVAPVKETGEGEGITVKAFFYDYFYKSQVFSVPSLMNRNTLLKSIPLNFMR
ncbi:MAG TPA: hypothetical protein PLL34_01955 [Candidatus Mcinerneyibacteriales bacterium]|nr:hypothetical protein [Candidatus Mcinerneyibacteriales bacterium]HPE19765.1 hypothetical protein [Candidatus Mcinerneyibacteriales bacterium]HPQ88715.1 hypothetical protein [Candidatus Mcinerneyibacteriales bacterium]